MRKLLITEDNSTNVILIALAAVSATRIFFFGTNAYMFLIAEFGLLLIASIFTKQFDNLWVLGLFGLNVFSLFATIALHSEGLGAVLDFMSIFMAIILFNNHPIDTETFKLFHLTISVILTIFLLTSNMQKLNSIYITTIFGRNINANIYGLIALACMFHYMCFIDKVKTKKLVKIISILCMYAFCIKEIYESECRSALMAAIAFTILCLFKKTAFSYTNFRFIVLSALSIGLLFTIWYYLQIDTMEDFQFMGKSFFSGRESVWANAWDLYLRAPIFGNGTGVQLAINKDIDTESAHNTMLSLMYVLGIIPTLTFVGCISKHFKRGIGDYNRISQFAFISSLIVTFFESFYADSYLFILFLSFLILERRNEQISERII